MIEYPSPPVPTVLPEGAQTAGILLSRDLIFTSKITGTASQLGHRVMVAGNVGLASTMIEQWKPKVVFVDLGAGELVSPAALLAFMKLAPSGIPFVAFGSHVDIKSLDDARAAGCDPVMPRSKFTQELPNLIRRYFDTSPGEAQAKV